MEVEILPVVGLFLPLEIVRTTHIELEPHLQRVDSAALQAHLTALARAEAQAKLAADDIDCEIASGWEDVTQDGGRMCVRAVYEVYTDIAVSRDALSEEVNRTWKTVR